MSEVEKVKAFYDYNPEIEWNRLEGFHFEFEITKRMMQKFMNPGKVLDIGCGPGRYSTYLAKEGFDVTAVDLSDGNVEFVKKKTKELKLDVKCYQADARDLSSLPLELYDYVLVMGPMYHLFSEEDRKKVIVEARKYLKPGGLIFVSFIGLHAGLNYYLDECPEELINEDDYIYLDALIENKTWSGTAFTEATFIEPDDIKPFFDTLEFEKVSIFGQEGVTATRLSFLEAQSEEVRNLYLELSLKMCENPKYFIYSSHIMYIGKK